MATGRAAGIAPAGKYETGAVELAGFQLRHQHIDKRLGPSCCWPSAAVRRSRRRVNELQFESSGDARLHKKHLPPTSSRFVGFVFGGSQCELGSRSRNDPRANWSQRAARCAFRKEQGEPAVTLPLQAAQSRGGKPIQSAWRLARAAPLALVESRLNLTRGNSRSNSFSVWNTQTGGAAGSRGRNRPLRANPARGRGTGGVGTG